MPGLSITSYSDNKYAILQISSIADQWTATANNIVPYQFEPLVAIIYLDLFSTSPKRHSVGKKHGIKNFGGVVNSWYTGFLSAWCHFLLYLLLPTFGLSLEFVLLNLSACQHARSVILVLKWHYMGFCNFKNSNLRQVLCLAIVNLACFLFIPPEKTSILVR